MKKPQFKQVAALVAILLGSAGAVAAYTYRVDLRVWYDIARREPLPPAVTVAELPTSKPTPAIPVSTTGSTGTKPTPKPTPEPVPTPTTSPSALPAEINLAVPMVYQAPFANWDPIHSDACEEASVIMVKGFLDGVKAFTRESMEEQILAIVDYEEKEFGYFEDTDAVETAKIMTDFLKIKNVKVMPVAAASDIRKQLAAGRPVILPVAGKLLKNPNFRNGGPDYHMIVIKGYTKSGRFISHDPGTRLGADYLYDESIIMDALHDWNGGDVLKGKKVMIVVE